MGVQAPCWMQMRPATAQYHITHALLDVEPRAVTAGRLKRELGRGARGERQCGVEGAAASAAGDVGGADTGVGGCGFLAANALQAAGEAAIGGVMNSNEASSILQAAHHHELRMRKARARRHAQTRQWVHW